MQWGGGERVIMMMGKRGGEYESGVSGTRGPKRAETRRRLIEGARLEGGSGWVRGAVGQWIWR